MITIIISNEYNCFNNTYNFTVLNKDTSDTIFITKLSLRNIIKYLVQNKVDNVECFISIDLHTYKFMFFDIKFTSKYNLKILIKESIKLLAAKVNTDTEESDTFQTVETFGVTFSEKNVRRCKLITDLTVNRISGRNSILTIIT